METNTLLSNATEQAPPETSRYPSLRCSFFSRNTPSIPLSIRSSLSFGLTIKAMDGIARLPASHWTSLGYSQEHADAMIKLNATLIHEHFRLNQSSKTVAESATKLDFFIGIDDDDANVLPEGSLLPDATLLPLWREFADALGALATNENVSIHLYIYNIQLPTWMLSILEPALKVTPLEHLMFFNNRLGRDVIKFVTSVLEVNRCLPNLYLWKNEIECGHEALLLVEAVTNHPVLNEIGLVECGIGHIIQITPEIVPAILSLKSVSLVGNDLGSHSASLISKCLATNPSIKRLFLHGNSFNDDDARLFAYSLTTNTNLKKLVLRDNNFTDAGLKTLYKSVYDEQSPNAIYDSNHTCQLDLFDEGGAQIPNGIDEEVLSMNDKRFERNIFPEPLLLRCERATNGNASGVHELLQIEGLKKVKMLHAIQGGNAGPFNMQWVERIPLELMPKVLAFLQESGKYAGTEDRSLDRLFQVIRSRQEVTSFHGFPDEERGSQQQHKKRRL